MHALEYCITDAKSARAVARALGRNHIFMGYGVSWSQFPDRKEHKIRGLETVTVDVETKLLLLCPCSSCTPFNNRMIKEYKCT